MQRIKTLAVTKVVLLKVDYPASDDHPEAKSHCS